MQNKLLQFIEFFYLNFVKFLFFKIENFSNLLFHEPLQLIEKNGKLIWDSVQKLKNKMKIEKIGFSIYSTTELDELLNKEIELDFEQLSIEDLGDIEIEANLLINLDWIFKG